MNGRVIPGRREAANPESSNPRSVITGFRAPSRSLCSDGAKRRSECSDGDIAEDIVRNAPATEDHFFVVPKVVE